MSQPPVAAALAALNIPHRVFRHSGPVHSLAQAAAERNQRPEQVVRSILFRLSEGRYTMVLVAGPAQVSWPMQVWVVPNSLPSANSASRRLAISCGWIS